MNPSANHMRRTLWLTGLLLILAAAAIAAFPHVPSQRTIPLFCFYGFFFMASYPITEAALMESVPDAVRGRVFGLFVMIGGIFGNLSHRIVGAKVRQLGPSAQTVSAYYPIYAGLAVILLASLNGLFFLDPIRKREQPAPLNPAPESLSLIP